MPRVRLTGGPHCIQHRPSTIPRSSSIRLLLGRGADVNMRTRSGSTPLHRASWAGALEIVRLLLEYGADVGAVHGEGKTALQVVGKASLEDVPVDQGRCDEITKLLAEHRTQ